MAAGEAVFNFCNLDSETYSRILHDLASNPELIGMKIESYKVLLDGLTQVIKQKGIEPVNDFLSISQILAKCSGQSLDQILEKWHLSIWAMPILESLAAHSEKKSLFDQQHFFIKILLQAATHELNSQLQPPIEKEDIPLPSCLNELRPSLDNLKILRSNMYLFGRPDRIGFFFRNLKNLNVSSECLMQYFNELPNEKDFLFSLKPDNFLGGLFKENYEWFFASELAVD